MSLPLRIKTGIRDLWDADGCDVKKSFATLKTLIGYEVYLEPEWTLLWNELKSNFPDNAAFVPTITNAVTAWCRAMEEITSDDENEDWTEELLENLKRSRGLKIVLEASKGRPTTRWLEQSRAFEICFPTTPNSPQSIHSVMTAGFHNDLRHAFKQPSQPLTSHRTSMPVRAAGTPPEEAWANVDAAELDSASVMTPTTTTDRNHFMGIASLDVLPNVNTIDRPEDLTMRPPYHMIVRTGSNDKEIVIQCSHQPSLELLTEYLKKWSKRNHNFTNKPPAAEVNLRASCFGLGTRFDHAVIEIQHNDSWSKLNTPLVLSLIEGVLGYRITYQDAYNWHFRRDTGFR